MSERFWTLSVLTSKHHSPHTLCVGVYVCACWAERTHAFLCAHVSVWAAFLCAALPSLAQSRRRVQGRVNTVWAGGDAVPGTARHTHMHTNTRTHSTGNLGNHSQSRTECTLRRSSLLPSSSYFSSCKLYPNYIMRQKGKKRKNNVPSICSWTIWHYPLLCHVCVGGIRRDFHGKKKKVAPLTYFIAVFCFLTSAHVKGWRAMRHNWVLALLLPPSFTHCQTVTASEVTRLNFAL